MPKEINEKTFELNITNELLNLSKSSIWYSAHPYLFDFLPIQNWDTILRFMNQATLFAEGLTQEEESNESTGGYDVSINYNHPSIQEGRLMFLQYKAGVRTNYSTIRASKFYKQTAASPEHILFKFNNAAGGTQHSTLRNLATSANIQPQSVFYVFPRVTEKTEFSKKVGNLVPNSSFVPVLEIDKQAPITIANGVSHKYRTSYDGLASEVNSLFFSFSYNINIITELLSELICIQIERFAKILIRQNTRILQRFLNTLLNSFEIFVENELELYPERDLLIKNVKLYIEEVLENFNSNTIPRAPSLFTNIIPR